MGYSIAISMSRTSPFCFALAPIFPLQPPVHPSPLWSAQPRSRVQAWRPRGACEIKRDCIDTVCFYMESVKLERSTQKPHQKSRSRTEGCTDVKFGRLGTSMDFLVCLVSLRCLMSLQNFRNRRAALRLPILPPKPPPLSDEVLQTVCRAFIICDFAEFFHNLLNFCCSFFFSITRLLVSLY